MQLIGFNFSKILAEKKKVMDGRIEVKSNIQVKSISPEKLEMIKDKDVLKFDFEFTIDYTPGVASICFEGFMLLIVEKEQSKEILKKWKTKKVSDDIRVPLFNIILTKCNLKALQFEEEFSLPTHIPFPKINPPQDKQGYVQ